MLLQVDLPLGDSTSRTTVLDTRPVAVEVRRLRRHDLRHEGRRQGAVRSALNRYFEEAQDDPDYQVGSYQFDAGLFLRRPVLLDIVV